MVVVSVAALVCLAFLMDLLGFLARDELKLRLLMRMGMVFYIAYFFLVSDAPLWDAILTDSILMVINLTVIFIITAERTTRTMSPRMASLSQQFEVLSPGQLVGEIGFLTGQTASGTMVLARGGEVLSWDLQALKRLLDRAPPLKSSMLAQFNLDLIKRLVNGVPLSGVKQAS